MRIDCIGWPSYCGVTARGTLENFENCKNFFFRGVKQIQWRLCCFDMYNTRKQARDIYPTNLPSSLYAWGQCSASLYLKLLKFQPFGWMPDLVPWKSESMYVARYRKQLYRLAIIKISDSFSIYLPRKRQNRQIYYRLDFPLRCIRLVSWMRASASESRCWISTTLRLRRWLFCFPGSGENYKMRKKNVSGNCAQFDFPPYLIQTTALSERLAPRC